MAVDRRSFLQLLSGSALAAAFPSSIAKALALPANHRTGTIQDVEHIVILMQENRSFDHYFGSLRGVRGFGDPRAVNLATGNSVWHQPDGKGGYVLPFHPPAPDMGMQFLEDLDHDWTSTQHAWNKGHHDGWVPTKGSTTMAHLTRSDIPYHYALADAFTVCDAYHCSLLGPTDPNRYHMWSGWVGNDGAGGGPVVDNAEAGYGWTTYPELLEKAGIRWKLYQDIGQGLDAENHWGDAGKDPYTGNYGDNALLYFHKYRNAPHHSPLAQKARTGTNIAAGGSPDGLFEPFRRDVMANTLPQVSWLVAPEAYSEHPNWPANYGAWYISQMLDALTANPDVWSKTAFFLLYDENDGFFDHMVPPTPPHGREQGLSTVDTTHEIFAGSGSGEHELVPGPYGLGMRVPMVVISPWSKGGYVNSQVFDHTSLIRFIEARFGPENPILSDHNITDWRSAVSGDLTSAFNFANPNADTVQLPATTAYLPPDVVKHADYKPLPPEKQAMPVQEPGTRPARALPYELHVAAEADVASNGFQLRFENTGTQTAVFHVRSASGVGDARMPRTYTVGPKGELSDKFALSEGGLSVYGPNGFFRHYAGGAQAHSVLQASLAYAVAKNGVTFTIRNSGAKLVEVEVYDAYSRMQESRSIAPQSVSEHFYPLSASSGWYELALTVKTDAGFRQHFAGHLETGLESRTDPAIAASQA